MGDRPLPLAVTMGDPAGVGPQIALAAWRALRESGELAAAPIYLVAMPAAIERAVRGLADPPALRRIASPDEAAGAGNALPVLPLAGDAPAPEPGRPDLAAAPAIIGSIRTAVSHVQAGDAAAVVTNPIAKALLYRAGFPHPGHTEFLAALAAERDAPPPRPVMMLCGGGLRVALAPIHLPLARVPAALSVELLVETATIVAAALARDFGLPRPRLAFAGLNPHAGEDGALGVEERDIVHPAAARLRAAGLDVSDARPGDVVFHEARQGRWDAVIAMYHDQGLIPVKTLDLWGGVNVTLGLPFIRTSPDHGVAYDAAAAGAPRADSLLAAIRLAARMAAARRTAQAR